MSDLRVASISGTDGTSPATLAKQSAAKAMALIQYPAGVPTPFKTLNVSSLTDLGVGDTRITFTNAMDSAVFSAVGTSGNAGCTVNTATFAAESYRNVLRNNAGSAVDSNTSNAVFGDLA